MVLWLSVSVDEYFKYLKEKVDQIKEKLNFEFGLDNLPYHISLKITFECPKDKEDEIIGEIENYFKTLKSFDLKPKDIEIENNIVWIRYFENDYISNVSKNLNKMLNEKFNIPYHPFDLNFIFHTTLFMLDNSEIVKQGYELIKNTELPEKVHVNKYMIGFSLTGEIGTYKVLKEIVIK